MTGAASEQTLGNQSISYLRPVNNELTVSDTDGIRAVADEISVWKVERRTLTVRLTGRDDDANAAIRGKILLYFGACGCHQGRVAGVFAFIAYSALVLSGVISVHVLGVWRVVLLYFAVSFAVMLVGKLIGLRNARHSLRRLADEIDSSMSLNLQDGRLEHG